MNDSSSFYEALRILYMNTILGLWIGSLLKRSFFCYFVVVVLLGFVCLSEIVDVDQQVGALLTKNNIWSK